MAVTTNFEETKQLLREAVNSPGFASENLIIQNQVTKTYMNLRVDNLARYQVIELGQEAASTTTGQVTEDPANRVIDVLIGVTGNNRVEYDQLTFAVPVDIRADLAEKGFMLGSKGTGANPTIALADVSMQYRFGPTDPWKNLAQASALKEVTVIQFAVDIADQTADSALPALIVIAQQV